jgi:hypothetical protein
MTSSLRGPSSLGKNSCADDATRDRSRDAGNAPDESFPSFLDEDSDSGNDSLPQAFEFSGRI